MPFPPIDPQSQGLFDHVDRSLSQLKIPSSLLRQLRGVDEFKPHDFQLDGVDAINEDGTHTQTPELVRPNFEWRKYGTPSIGLQWRQVPVDDTVEFNNRTLDAETLAKQRRMTERAFQAYQQGGGGYMGDRILERQFIISDQEKDRRTKAQQRARAVHGELRERIDAAKALQARIRSSLLRPMYPWLYIARLAQYRLPAINPKKSSKHSESNLGSSAIDVPDLPWCQCWTSLEPTYELDPKSTQHMRQIVGDFEFEKYESCLRRVDNLVASQVRRRPKNATDYVLVELAALCNRFGVRLFFLGRIEHSHAFFERVFRFTNNSSTCQFTGKAELFSWTCDLVGYCLWIQKKFEQSHWTISRSAPSNAPFNGNIVSRLHATQILVKLDKPDLAVALGSKVLIELMQARHDHNVALFLRQDPPNFNQILKIVEHLDERGHQTASPSYLNLLCHQAQTIVFALARKGRREDAITINKIVQRQATGIEGKRKGVTNDLVNCINEFDLSTDPMTTQATMNVLYGMDESITSLPTLSKGPTDSGEDEPGTTKLLDGVTLARDAMKTTNARFASTGVDVVDSQAIVENMPSISYVASGVVGFEPPKDEPGWTKEFFSDVYWQRHSNLRMSKHSYTKSLTKLVSRPSFR